MSEITLRLKQNKTQVKNFICFKIFDLWKSIRKIFRTHIRRSVKRIYEFEK